MGVLHRTHVELQLPTCPWLRTAAPRTHRVTGLQLPAPPAGLQLSLPLPYATPPSPPLISPSSQPPALPVPCSPRPVCSEAPSAPQHTAPRTPSYPLCPPNFTPHPSQLSTPGVPQRCSQSPPRGDAAPRTAAHRAVPSEHRHRTSPRQHCNRTSQCGRRSPARSTVPQSPVVLLGSACPHALPPQSPSPRSPSLI